MNLYGMAVNDTINHYDIIGACKDGFEFVINAGSGCKLQEFGKTALSNADRKMAMELISKMAKLAEEATKQGAGLGEGDISDIAKRAGKAIDEKQATDADAVTSMLGGRQFFWTCTFQYVCCCNGVLGKKVGTATKSSNNFAIDKSNKSKQALTNAMNDIAKEMNDKCHQ